MKNINIIVENKRATVVGSPVIVCGNSDYTVTFQLDNEWSLTGPKTARFVYVKQGEVMHEDRVFEGNTVAVPVLSDVAFVNVGVFAGDLCTTTPARVNCHPSILCGSGAVQEPTPDVYSQIMALFNEMAEKGAFGATEEQAQQIEQNRRDTAQLAASKADRADMDELEAQVGQHTQSITQLSTEKANQVDMAVLAARMDAFTRLEEGSTTGDAELADIRVGANGKTYATAGDAVRGQVGDLMNDLDILSKEMNGVKSFIAEELINSNMAYTEEEFTPIVGNECVVCGYNELSFYVSNPQASGFFVGMLLERDYMNFNSNALYLLAFARPEWEPNGVGLVFSTDTALLYQVSFNSDTLREHEIQLNKGDKNQFRVYQKNGLLLVNVGGVVNEVDVTQIPIVPTATSLGYWSNEDINFGVVFTNEETEDTPKVIGYEQGNTMLQNTVYYALGDSLTAGSYSNPDGTAVAVSDAKWGYPQLIADAIGCEVHNLGIPGGSSSEIYVSELPKVGADATLITLMTGTNDYSIGSELGTFEDTEWGTHMGRVYQIVSELIQKCPTARVVLLTPPPSAGDLTRDDIATNYRRGTPSSAGWTYDDLVEEYEKFCKKYGIEFVNVMWNSPINTFNLWNMLPDATHPTKEAYKPLAQYIYSQLF